MQRSEVTAIVNCPVRRQFNASRSLRQVALQSIWLSQESLLAIHSIALPYVSYLRYARNRPFAPSPPLLRLLDLQGFDVIINLK
jgi:hypothetical protein